MREMGKIFASGNVFVAVWWFRRFPVVTSVLRPAAMPAMTKRFPPPNFQATATINFSKLSRFNTRLRLYASVIRLHSVRTLARPFNVKWV